MRIAIIDTETTGLSDRDEPISLGLLLVEVDDRGGLVREVSRYAGFQNPTAPMNPIAQRVHGITLEFLAGKAFDRDAINGILAQTDIAVAHNVPFDARMLAKVAPYRGAWRCSYHQFPWNAHGGRRRLDDVCMQFSVTRPHPHASIDDCEALLACLLQRTGKTDRSRTYLGALLSQNAFRVSPARPPSRATRTAPTRVDFEVRVFKDHEALPPSREASPSVFNRLGRLLANLFG